jgi:hypothetical protein
MDAKSDTPDAAIARIGVRQHGAITASRFTDWQVEKEPDRVVTDVVGALEPLPLAG